MGNGGSYISHEGYIKLEKQLKELKVRRRVLAKEIGTARMHGDLKENAEYKYAKEAQAHNETNIAKLEEKLSNSQMLDDTKIPKDEALLGATVKIKDLDSGEECEYMLVDEIEADFAQNKISVTSPIGKGLLGYKKGQTVNIVVPAGTLKYKILKISR